MKLFKRMLAMLAVIAITMSGLAFAETAESAPVAEIAATEPAAAVEEASVEEAAVEEAVVEEEPTEETLVGEIPVEESPEEEMPVEEAPAEEVPAEETAEEGGAAAPMSPCDHPKEYVGEYSYPVSAQYIDGEKHLTTYYTYEEYYCSICGYTYPSDDYTSYTVEENHNWQDGECNLCGAVNPCTHPGMKQTDEYYWDVEVISADAARHTISAKVNRSYECPDCKERRWEDSDDKETVTGAHEWDYEGSCYICQWENSCTHANKKVIHEYRENQEILSTNDEGHTIQYNRAYEFSCPDCGMDSWITETEFSTMTEAHEWNSEGTCYICKASNPCTHPNADMNSGGFEVEAVISTTEWEHTVSGYNITYGECPDCGQYFRIRDTELTTITQPHSWNERGICWECNAVNSCKHENMQMRNSYREPIEIVSYDDKGHTGVFMDVTWYFCPDCDQDKRVEGDETYTLTEPHRWWNGKCEACNVVNPCIHANRYVDYIDEVPVKILSTTNDSHTFEYQTESLYICMDCGEESWETDETIKTKTENHRWNEGKCYVCKAVNSCTHKNKDVEGSHNEVVSIISSDEKGHSCIYRKITWMLCLDCGESFSERAEETFTLSGGHRWWDGRCEDCNWLNSCTHEERYAQYTNDYCLRVLSKDERTHTFEYRDEVSYVCPDCGEEEWVQEGPVKTKTETHNWNKGKCYLCEAVNSCKHAKKVLDYSGSRTQELISKDARTHTVKVQDFDHYVCTACGEGFDETDGKIYEKKEAHWWERGSCWECGQTNSCAHKKSVNAVYEDHSSAQAVDGHTHKTRVNVMQETTCVDCGEITRKLLESEERIDNHSFENGYCLSCGYENSCAHKNKVTVEREWFKNAESKNSKAHIISYRNMKITYCADCNEELSREETGSKKNEQPHSFNAANICDQCGYESTCKHSSLKESVEEIEECIAIDARNHRVRKFIETVSSCRSCGCSINNAYSNSIEDVGVKAHSFRDGRCTGCGLLEPECEHQYKNGKCIHCGKSEKNEEEEQKLEIRLVESAMGLIVGDKGYLHAELIGGSGTLKYSSSNRSVATVSDDGTVTAKKYGAAVITVSCGDAKATCEISVYEAPKSVKLSKSKLSLGLDGTAQLTAAISPSKAFPDLGWSSSNEAVVTVDENGFVTAVGVGSAVVTAYSELYYDIYADCRVTVIESAGELVLDVSELTLAVKDKYTLNASVLPDTAEAELSYSSSDSKVASVTSKGVITARKAGDAVITVSTESGLEKSVTVTVLKAPTKVTLNEKKLSVGVGESFQLTAEIPEGSYSSSFSWKSSKTSVAAVDENGFVTVLAAGKATITVKTSNGKSARCSLTVLAAPESISLSANTLKLGEGQSTELKVTLPRKTASSIVWSCSGDAVRVSDGVVTALKAGTATVTATAVCGGATDSCTVTVLKAPDSIAVESVLDMVVKEKYTLTAVPMAGDAEAAGACSFKLKSGRGVVTVDDESGLITAKKAGSAVITVETYNGVTAECSITVHTAPKSVKLSATRKTLAVGESFELTAAVSPTTAFNKGFTVTVSKDGIASIEGEDGVYTITAEAEGRVKITITATNGKKASCTVTVK